MRVEGSTKGMGRSVRSTGTTETVAPSVGGAQSDGGIYEKRKRRRGFMSPFGNFGP